jgi:SAM-dependent methyltransferase
VTENKNEAEALARLRGPGGYPVEFAGWLLNPLRHLICPAGLIVRRLRLEPSDRVLEIGSGPGYFSPSIARRLTAGQLTLFDMQAGMLAMAARRLAKRGQRHVASCAGDAARLPFKDGSFDVALMVAVLGEVTDRRAALREAARVLRPGGRLSVTELPGDPDFVALDRLRAEAREAGFVFQARFGPRWYFTCNFTRAAEQVRQIL